MCWLCRSDLHRWMQRRRLREQLVPENTCECGMQLLQAMHIPRYSKGIYILYRLSHPFRGGCITPEAASSDHEKGVNPEGPVRFLADPVRPGSIHTSRPLLLPHALSPAHGTYYVTSYPFCFRWESRKYSPHTDSRDPVQISCFRHRGPYSACRCLRREQSLQHKRSSTMDTRRASWVMLRRLPL